LGRFTALVTELQACAAAGRQAYAQACSADGDVSASELGELAVALAVVDRASQAASVAALAQFARREEVEDPDDIAAVLEKVHAVGYVEEFAGTDVALTLGISVRSADSRLDQAAQLTSRLPRVLARVAEGLVELGQAHRVLYETAEIESLEVCHAVDAYVAERIGSCDPTRLGALARYAIGRICPAALRQRATRNLSDRRFTVGPGPAGLAEIYALVPAAQAAAMWEAACELARSYQEDDPDLTADQARADAFVDLALANVHISATVSLGVPVMSSDTSDLGDNRSQADSADTARDSEQAQAPRPPMASTFARDLASEQDAEEWELRRDVDNDPWFARHQPTIDGHPPAFAGQSGPGGLCLSGVHLPKVGYVPPDVVAGLVSQVGTRVGLALLDAKTGTLLATTDAYRPTAAMRQFITIRDQRCRMFGCQLRAEHWDLDHAVAHPRGPTTPTNLAGLCRRHHRAKQRRRWRYHLRPDGVATWQSPTGAIRVTYPEHHLPPPAEPPSAEPPPVAAAAIDEGPPF